MNTVTTPEEAKTYLMSNPSHRLRVTYHGKSRTLFYNSRMELFGMLNPGCRKNGTVFSDWGSVTGYTIPGSTSGSKAVTSANLVEKYKTKAQKASFSNSWLRKIVQADPSKSLYENGITTGSRIDGKVITVKSLEKADSYEAQRLRRAIATHTPYRSCRFPFRGYEATIEAWKGGNDLENELHVSLSLEYKDCGNGYYYLLINDNEFIGYETD